MNELLIAGYPLYDVNIRRTPSTNAEKVGMLASQIYFQRETYLDFVTSEVNRYRSRDVYKWVRIGTNEWVCYAIDRKILIASPLEANYLTRTTDVLIADLHIVLSGINTTRNIKFLPLVTKVTFATNERTVHFFASGAVRKVLDLPIITEWSFDNNTGTVKNLPDEYSPQSVGSITLHFEGGELTFQYRDVSDTLSEVLVFEETRAFLAPYKHQIGVQPHPTGGVFFVSRANRLRLFASLQQYLKID